MTTATPLDPVTLRAIAAEMDEAAEVLHRCCGGAHVYHRERLAIYIWLASDYRTKALRAEADAKERS
jgi:hypothetical protein